MNIPSAYLRIAERIQDYCLAVREQMEPGIEISIESNISTQILKIISSTVASLPFGIRFIAQNIGLQIIIDSTTELSKSDPTSGVSWLQQEQDPVANLRRIAPCVLRIREDDPLISITLLQQIAAVLNILAGNLTNNEQLDFNYGAERGFLDARPERWPNWLLKDEKGHDVSSQSYRVRALMFLFPEYNRMIIEGRVASNFGELASYLPISARLVDQLAANLDRMGHEIKTAMEMFPATPPLRKHLPF